MYDVDLKRIDLNLFPNSFYLISQPIEAFISIMVAQEVDHVVTFGWFVCPTVSMVI